MRITSWRGPVTMFGEVFWPSNFVFSWAYFSIVRVLSFGGDNLKVIKRKLQ